MQAPQMALHLLQVPDLRIGTLKRCSLCRASKPWGLGQAVFQLSNVCSLVAKGVQHFENCVLIDTVQCTSSKSFRFFMPW